MGTHKCRVAGDVGSREFYGVFEIRKCSGPLKGLGRSPYVSTASLHSVALRCRVFFSWRFLALLSIFSFFTWTDRQRGRYLNA